MSLQPFIVPVFYRFVRLLCRNLLFNPLSTMLVWMLLRKGLQETAAPGRVLFSLVLE